MAKKHILVSDIHFGLKDDNEWFHDKIITFFKSKMIPLLNSDEYDLFILGDLFEHRKYIDISTLNRVIDFFDSIPSNITINVLYGNHDVYYNSTNKVNSIDFLARIYENINIIDSPTIIDDVLCLPWINQNNLDDSLSAIEKSKCNSCYGHFDIIGAEMTKGNKAKRGLEPKLFKKFKNVFSGHYHLQSKLGNITYIGSPIQSNFGDTNETKGFIIHDTETNTYERVDNDIELYKIVNYNDIANINEYTDKIVKVIIDVDESYDRQTVLYELDKLREIAYKVEILERNKIAEIIKNQDSIENTNTLDNKELIEAFCEKTKIDSNTLNYVLELYNVAKKEVVNEE